MVPPPRPLPCCEIYAADDIDWFGRVWEGEGSGPEVWWWSWERERGYSLAGQGDRDENVVR